MQYGRIVIVIFFPAIMNSMAVNMYSKYGFKYHSHLSKVSNIFCR